MNWINISSEYKDLPVVRAAVNALPHIGGSLDILLAAKGEELANQRISEFIKMTGESLANIDKSLFDLDFVISPKFFEIFREIIDKVKRTYESEKIELLRNAFLNSLHKNQTQNPLIFSFLNIVEVISIKHIQILKLFFQDRGDIPSELDNKMNRYPRYAGIINFPKEEYNLIIEDLLRLSLLGKQGIGTLGVGGGWDEISDLGKAFVEFILEQ